MEEESKNPNLDEEEKEKKSKIDMINHQEFLNQNGAVYMIFSILSDNSNPKTSNEIYSSLINFGIKLLN